MLQTGESENEILLGNKQLLAIFFVVVLLLGVAFAGGYKLGQASKKSGPAAATDVTASTTSSGTQTTGQTHEVVPGENGDSTASTDTSNAPAAGPDTEPPAAAEGPAKATSHTVKTPPREQPAEDTEAAAPSAKSTDNGRDFVPQPGQMFLQVAAVGRDEAEAVADVLHKKGFRAHAVPKPGSPKIYRVLIGPLRDAADLNSTRDSLRRTGFREVITQRY